MNGSRNRVAVLGAGGRAGRAIVREAADRGLPVVAVVRDPRRHADLATDDVKVVEGDALDASSVIAIIDPSVSGIVSAVTPFTVPPRDFSTFDPQFFARAATSPRRDTESWLRLHLPISLRTARAKSAYEKTRRTGPAA